MLDQIEGLIKKYAQEAVSESKVVPEDKANQVSGAATESITDLLKQKASSQDFSSLLESFGQEAGIQNMVSQLSGDFIKNLTKQGMNKGNAQNIASVILPMILSKLSGKSGGGGMMDVLTQLAGKGDLGSLLGGLTGGSTASKKNNGGGLLGKMKDLLQ